jgi:beta-glucanase (GH16 family)
MRSKQTSHRRPTARRSRKTGLRPIHIHIGIGLASILVLFAVIGVNSWRNQHAAAGPPAAPSGKIWQLKWGDDFSNSSIDTSKWNVQNNSGYGGGNREDQCYNAANVSTTGGVLKLTAQRQTVTCGATNPDTGNSTYYFTSGMVTTRAQGGSMKYKFKQGYIEARIKAPKGNPYWPAFWLVSPNDGSTPGWPDYGEFDITEMYGARPDVTNGSMHYSCTKSGNHCQVTPTWYNIKTDSTYGGTSTLGTQITNQSQMDAYSGGTTDFNTYGFLWEDDRLTWYVNGRKTRYLTADGVYRIEQNGAVTLENSIATLGTPDIPFSTVFGYDHSINLNLAVGGDGPRYSYYGYTGQDTAGGYVDGNYVAQNPGAMEVDYVRVYQLANEPEPEPEPEPDPEPTPDPDDDDTPTPNTPGGSKSNDSKDTDDTPTEKADDSKVTVVEDKDEVSGNAVLDPALQEDEAVQKTVAKVEYYVNGELFQTITEAPFSLDTSELKNGTYEVREKVYYKDGKTSEKTATIQVNNVANKTESDASSKLTDEPWVYALLGTLLLGTVLLLWGRVRRPVFRAFGKLRSLFRKQPPWGTK